MAANKANLFYDKNKNEVALRALNLKNLIDVTQRA